MINLPLPEKISQDLAANVKFRTITLEFGNGYSQVKPDGINNKYSEWNITWDTLSLAQRDIVIGALYAAGGAEIIMWQPPGYDVPQRFRMTDDGFSFAYRAGDVFIVSTTLKQVF